MDALMVLSTLVWYLDHMQGMQVPEQLHPVLVSVSIEPSPRREFPSFHDNDGVFCWYSTHADIVHMPYECMFKPLQWSYCGCSTGLLGSSCRGTFVVMNVHPLLLMVSCSRLLLLQDATGSPLIAIAHTQYMCMLLDHVSLT